MALFQTACLEGRVELDRNMAIRVSFRDLPLNARHVFRYAMPVGPDNLPGQTSTLPSDLAPAVIYRMTYASETYLIAPDQSTDMQFSGVCAVVTRGDHFEEAKNIILTRDVSFTGIPGDLLPYASIFHDGYRLSAGRYNGWTIVSTVPERPPVRSE